MPRAPLGDLLALIFLAVGTFSVSYSQAQTFPPGNFSIDGIPVSCNGVWTILDANLNDAGHAYPAMNGNPPVIVLNPNVVGNMPTSAKMFVYAHECGHHIVGLNEGNADCWAVKTGKQQGWFSEDDMQFLVNQFAWSPGDWTHAPGQIRLQNIWQCFLTG
jgi:hypothetical protein